MVAKLSPKADDYALQVGILTPTLRATRAPGLVDTPHRLERLGGGHGAQREHRIG